MAGRCSALSTPPAYHQMSPERCAEFDAMPHCDLTRLSIPRLSLTRRKISVVFGGSYVPVVVTYVGRDAMLTCRLTDPCTGSVTHAHSCPKISASPS
jgi:hypothetical protein